MTDKKQETDDLFSEDNIPESKWFKFENVGDKVKGVVTENPYIKKGQDEMPDQKVFELEQEDGEIIKVGIALHKNFIIERTQKVRKGDKVGFKFERELDPPKKGYAKPKSIVPYVVYTEEGDQQRDIEKNGEKSAEQSADEAFGDM